MRSATVPLFWDRACAGLAIENQIRFAQYSVRVGSDQDIGSNITGDRAFGVGAHRKAGDPQYGCLFLDTAAVGENHSATGDQAEEWKIAHGVYDSEAWMKLELLQPGCGAGMDREDDRDPFCNGIDRPEDRSQTVGGIHVGRSVQCEDGVLPGHQAVHQRKLAGVTDLLIQRIDHGVADEVNLLRGNALIPQILSCRGVSREEKVRNGIRAEAVDLFRHGHIARA